MNMKPTIYGERFAYKYKDNIISRPTLNFHDIYLMQYALEQANIEIPAIKKAYEENWKILTLILREKDLTDQKNGCLTTLSEQIKETRKLLKKAVKKSGFKGDKK